MDGVRDGGRLRHGGIADPAGVDDAHEEGRHVVEHDGDDHFVLPARDLENAGDHAPEAAGQHTRQQRQHDAAEAGRAREVARQECRDRAHEELALAAEVKHAALIREARAQSREHEGRGLGQRRADTGLGAERALEQIFDCEERIRAQRRHNNAADDERQKDRQQRHKERAEAFFQFFHITLPPLTYRSWQG